MKEALDAFDTHYLLLTFRLACMQFITVQTVPVKYAPSFSLKAIKESLQNFELTLS